MKWLKEYELGIDAIDNQHKRIVEYINELEKAHGLGNEGYITFVLDGLVDYTLTHFQFEEGMQEKAGYPFLKAHKRIHAIYIKGDDRDYGELVRRHMESNPEWMQEGLQQAA
jgi:hemerythrin